MNNNFFLLGAVFLTVFVAGCTEQSSTIGSQKIIDKSFVIGKFPESTSMQFHELTGKGTYTIEVTSTIPITVTVADYKDFLLWKETGVYGTSYYSECGMEFNVVKFNTRCTVEESAGVVIKNIEKQGGIVDLKVFRSLI